MAFQNALLLVLLCGAAEAQVLSDVTEDGLVRVPSSIKAGVYRLPEATFSQYRRVMLAPASVAFRKNWDSKNNLDRLDTGLKPSERKRIADDMALAFHEELVAELVERGGFALAEAPGPDVLLISPAITELDITAPNASNPGSRSFVRTAGSMTIIMELRDSASGVTVGRIIDYEQARETREFLLVNHVAEARIAFANAARYARSAVNIAKTERDETATAPR